MEAFAGFPNTAQPRYWSSFNASCHGCHATAAIQSPEYFPQLGSNRVKKLKFFPFTVLSGKLSPQYNGSSGNGPQQWLSVFHLL